MYRFRFTPYTQVTGIENIRPGIDGDQVSVELLPFQKWEDSSNDLLLDSEEDDVDDEEEEAEEGYDIAKVEFSPSVHA